MHHLHPRWNRGGWSIDSAHEMSHQCVMHMRPCTKNKSIEAHNFIRTEKNEITRGLNNWNSFHLSNYFVVLLHDVLIINAYIIFFSFWVNPSDV